MRLKAPTHQDGEQDNASVNYVNCRFAKFRPDSEK